MVDGEPELEEAALAGRLPWIDDPDDDGNRSSQGIDRQIVLSPILTRLAQRAFGDGLRDPLKRPGLGEWVDALDTAADFTVRCPDCKSTYYPRGTRCPFCDSAIPEFVVAFVRRFDPNAGCIVSLKNLPVLALTQAETLPITRRVTVGTRGKSANRREFQLRFGWQGSQRVIEMSDLDDADFWATTPDGTALRGPIPVGAGHILHLGPQGSAHRVLEFKMAGGHMQ